MANAVGVLCWMNSLPYAVMRRAWRCKPYKKVLLEAHWSTCWRCLISALHFLKLVSTKLENRSFVAGRSSHIRTPLCASIDPHHHHSRFWSERYMSAEPAKRPRKPSSHETQTSSPDLLMSPSDTHPQPREQYLPRSTVSPDVIPPRCPSSVRLPSSVRIVEVGPRDGLQNEKSIVDTATKAAMVHELADAGLRSIEVTGFVSPKWVPQLADASTVMKNIRKKHGVSYSALVPNMKGLRAALAAGVEEIAVFASATEEFSMHNVNCTIKESLDRFRSVTAAALSHGIKVRGYVSCVVGCPYEGTVDPEAVARVASALWQMGCYEISLGDTIGAGNPKSVVRVIHAVLSRGIPVSAIAIHCHDTRGTALANVLAAMSTGVSVIDSSVAGLGGCPFAPGAAGNLATEDLVWMLQGMDIDIGPVDLEKLIKVGRRMSAYLKREISSRVSIADACSGNVHPSHRSSS